MNVTIIGSGNMARGIGDRLVAGGNSVRIIDRDPEKAGALAGELRGVDGAKAEAGSLGDPIEGDIVILAVPYGAVESIAGQYGSGLAGKVVVDITNPVDWESFDRLVTPPDSSAAEEIGNLLPESAVVKAFNTTFAGTLVGGEVDGQPLDVFVAADDTDAKQTVISLIEAGGLRPIDAGPLRRARQLEALGFLHMTLQQPLGTGFGSTVKVLG
ncbi:MAG TPA: NADPH-dependent F420 reductase [Rubrobacteraceae bacterium]|nr:NADPH-dependent F420 reductase [Rubrobacteraceae bacterium]